MSEPVIPYAARAADGLTGRELFGVVVRSVGLFLVLWGLYTVAYLLGVSGVATASRSAQGAPMAPVGPSPESFFAMAAFLLGVGLALLRGEWLVRFAYAGSGARAKDRGDEAPST